VAGRGKKRPAAIRDAEVKVALAKSEEKEHARTRAKKAEPVDVLSRFNATVASIRKDHGDSRLRAGSDFPDLDRVPCGIFALDLALGATGSEVGFPRGRITLLAGMESSCKTLVCLWLMREFQNRGEPVIYVDAEKSWDKAWAEFNGVNVNAVLVHPSENMEQTLDMLAEFVRVMPNGLIVVDSFAQLTPKSEIESSFVEWQQGLMARIANKGFRSLQAGANTASNEFLTGGPTIVIVQQFRSSISTGMDKVMPGGQGQLFAGSCIVHMRAGPKIWYTPGDGEEDSGARPKSKEALVVGRTFHFDVVKNKTNTPYRFGEFKFYTARVSDPVTGAEIHKATTNVFQQVVYAAARVGVLQRNGAHYRFGDRVLGQGANQAGQALAQDPDLYDAVYAGIIASETASLNKGVA
jgi:recombination protein RecA